METLPPNPLQPLVGVNPLPKPGAVRSGYLQEINDAVRSCQLPLQAPDFSELDPTEEELELVCPSLVLHSRCTAVPTAVILKLAYLNMDGEDLFDQVL